MNPFLASIFYSGPFMPHGHCYLWTPGLLWLHVLSDALIVFAYYSIPITLVYFVHHRKDLHFGWMFLCFAVFIIACGTTHLMEIWNVWHGNYWLSGGVKAVTAMASVPTAFLLTRLVTPALKLPSTADLEKLNLALEQEVATRTLAEETVRQFNAELERRVEERTAELHAANEDLKRLQEERERLLVSERAAREEAERVSRLKDEFLTTLSHELRTPLNAIYGWSQVLRGGAANPADAMEGIAIIARNAHAQKQIIDDLLDMSAILSGKLRVELGRVPLAPIIEAAAETVRPAADAKAIRLETTLETSAPPVLGDANRLQQVFWNLLSNAIKFTPRGGRVQVTLRPAGAYLEVRVTDSGQGIAPEFLPYVFDRFRQQDASATRRHGGLGLGLAIVKQLVELHGGTVRAQSGGIDQGATFTVALPVTLPPGEIAANQDAAAVGGGSAPEAEPDPLAASAGMDLTGVRVLAVDDEADARALVKRVLEIHGARVHVVASAADAVTALTAEQPDVLVSDIGMPGENGYELIRRVRRLDAARGGNVPALALTAYARPEDRMKAVRAGFQMHMAKPIEPAELVTMVASLAGRIVD